MAFWNRKKAEAETPAQAAPLASKSLDGPGWQPLFGGFGSFGISSAGIDVTPISALQISTAYACVKALSSDVAKLPIELKRRSRRGGWEVLDDHPIARLLRHPNERQTTFEFLSSLVFGHQLNGNGYAAIMRDASGIPAALISLVPGNVSIQERPNGDLMYRATSKQFVGWKTSFDRDRGPTRRFFSEDMLHIRNMSLDGGIYGMSPLNRSSETFGIALAAQKLAATHFANGAHIDGVLMSQERLNKETAEQVGAAWSAAASGLQNSGKTPVLGNGLTFQRTGMSPEESQLLDTRKFAALEVCRVFRMPPHKVGIAEVTSYNSVEAANSAYLDEALMAITRPIEELFDSMLLDGDPDLKLRFNYDELLRTDSISRFGVYQIALNNGVFNRNEVREMEGRGPVPGGETYRIPMNTGVAGSTAGSPLAEVKPVGNDDLDNGPAPDTEEGAE